MAASFVKNIGKVRFNGFSADLYENKDGSASIRFDKYTKSLPSKTFLNFSSLTLADTFIKSKEGSNGLNTLFNILDFANIL